MSSAAYVEVVFVIFEGHERKVD